VADENRTPLWNADWGFRLAARGINNVAEITWSDIFEVVAGVAEVRKIPEGASALTLNGSPTSLPVIDIQFVRLGSLTVYDMDAGGMAI
jgi:hypothetical protein